MIGLPLPIGLKNIELKFKSRIIMVIPLANTGIDKIINIDVTIIDQQNRVKLFLKYKFVLRLIIDITKFIDLKIDDIPLMCRDKIIKLVAIIVCKEMGG